MSKSLYEKIGGEAAVSAAVDIFYRKMLADSTLAGFFSDTDMVKQTAMQKSFLTMAFGGPNNYTGDALRKAHAPLVQKGLNSDHFASTAGHLQATLEELNVDAELIAEVMTLVGGTRADVLGE